MAYLTAADKKMTEEVSVHNVQKRDGTTVPFLREKIVDAIVKAMVASGEGSEKEAGLVADRVYADILRITKKYKNFVPTVEGIQDSVEKELILSEYVKTAKSYILYRERRAKIRGSGVRVPPKVKKLAEESKKYFKNPLGEFVYYRSYSRWIEREHRRETWIETVDRYIAFMKENLGDKLTETEYAEVREGILRQEAMPSMRLLQFAGPAARRTNVCAYNCSYIAPEKFQDLAEIMYISMCGTGCGFSVESRNARNSPRSICKPANSPTHMPDTKEGWADALALGMRPGQKERHQL